MKRPTLLLLLLIIFGACVPNARITRRYKEAKPEYRLTGDSIKNYVGVDLFVLDTDPTIQPSRRTVFDLEADGQAELIKQIGEIDKNTDKLIAALQSPLSAKKPASEVVDLTKFAKRIVFTIHNRQPSFGNRITNSEIRVKFPGGFKLVSCNKLMTTYETIDLGKMTLTQANQAELTPNASTGFTNVFGGNNSTKTTTLDKRNDPNTITTEATLGNTDSKTNTGTVGISGKISASRTLAEEVLLRQRIIMLNASIKDNTLYITQQGISGIDLAGNTTADVIIDTKENVAVKAAYSFSGLIAKDTLQDAKNIFLTETTLIFPNYREDIKSVFKN